MACNKCGSSSCSHNCHNTCMPCITQTKGSCVFYQGGNLSCLGVTKGDTFDKSLKLINDKLCSLTPPSGVVYTGVDGEITVINDVIGIDPTYTNTINVEIENLQEQIDTLQDCSEAAISSITTTTPGITISSIPNPSGCGNITTIDYLGSTPDPVKVGGVVVNNALPVANISTIYSTPIPTSSLSLVVGDIISIKGQLSRTPTKIDIQSYLLTDTVNTLTISDVHDNAVIGNLNKLNTFEISLLVTGVTVSTLTVKVVGTFTTDSVYSYAAGTSIKTITGTYINYIGHQSLAFNKSAFAIGIPNTDAPTLETFVIELKRKI